jgi:hypothetical protein
MLRRKRNSLTSGNCTLRDEKEPMVFWAKRWSGCAALGGEELDEWQLYVEGREKSYVRVLGDVCWVMRWYGRRDMLCRKRNSLTSGNCTLRDEKEPMVFWAKRWSALGGEQLDEWQLYVEGRQRSYGTCAGR